MYNLKTRKPNPSSGHSNFQHLQGHDPCMTHGWVNPGVISSDIMTSLPKTCAVTLHHCLSLLAGSEWRWMWWDFSVTLLHCSDFFSKGEAGGGGGGGRPESSWSWRRQGGGLWPGFQGSPKGLRVCMQLVGYMLDHPAIDWETWTHYKIAPTKSICVQNH